LAVVLHVIPNLAPKDESCTTKIWLFAVTAEVLTTRVETPVDMATLPDGADPHTDGEAVDAQFVVGATDRVAPSKVRPLPTTSDLIGFRPFPTKIPPNGVVLAVPPCAVSITLEPTQVPFTAKQPPVRLIPAP